MRLAGRRPHLLGGSDSPLASWLGEVFPDSEGFAFAVHIGTTSIYVKDTVQCLDRKGGVLAYLKVPRGCDAFGVVRHEADILGQLAHRFSGEDFYPRLLGRRGGSFLQSAHATKPSSSADPGPGWILARLSASWQDAHPWHLSPVRGEILEALRVLRSADATGWVDILERADTALSRRFGITPIRHPLSHGDFVPWNLRPGPFAFDWEWSAPRLPWHDAFHYLWMPRILEGRAPDAGRVWAIWQSPEGAALRMDQPLCEQSGMYALGYLAWQLSFYASATVRNSETLEAFPLLTRLRDLLDQFLESDF